MQECVYMLVCVCGSLCVCVYVCNSERRAVGIKLLICMVRNGTS